MDSSPNVEDTPSGKDQSSRLAMERKPTCRTSERIPAAAGMPTSGDIIAATAGATRKTKSATMPCVALVTFAPDPSIVSPLAFVLIPRATSNARLAAAPSGTIATIAETSVKVVPSLPETNASLRSRLVDGIAPFAAALAPHAGSGHVISNSAAMSAMRSACPRAVIVSVMISAPRAPNEAIDDSRTGVRNTWLELRVRLRLVRASNRGSRSAVKSTTRVWIGRKKLQGQF